MDAHAAQATAPGLIRLSNLRWVALALAAMLAAIVSGDLWALNFAHVLTGLMWTGIDLFTGFVLGPIMRSVDLPTRRAIVIRLMPRMIFIMPTLSIITPTTGWYLAQRLGFLDLPWPSMWWMVAALGISTLLAIQGLGVLLPTNLRVCFELQKERPDFERIGRLMRRYVWTVASQGTLQVGIIVVMSRFATGI
ncbi:MAG: hypothetical protein KIT16_03750 [Rhodospirillaceae bacterium]|nr:hypothetical protein [Rhodospirillaceae bacterium]